MSGVQLLQKKLNLLETDITVHQDQIDTLDRQANQFMEENHFDSGAIQMRQRELGARYEALEVSVCAKAARTVLVFGGRGLPIRSGCGLSILCGRGRSVLERYGLPMRKGRGHQRV